MLAHQIPHRAILTRYIEIAPDVRHFWFEVPDLPGFDFIPGQFVSLSEQVNGKKVTRAYSIASVPRGNTFELCLNEVVDGIFSPFLFRLHPGDDIEMKGPHGMFILKQPPANTMMVATGTGIAPFLPMLQDRLLKDSINEYILVFGVRYDHSVLYKAEFEELARQHRNFKFICTVTRPGPDWTGNAGRVQQYVFQELADRRDFDVYICGLKEMVNDVRDRLKELGFDKKQIIFERYD
ncbi:MAG TPA: FAD-binding oxidoreductase [Bryobacteraceae bacterium]|nr:FAD-binding oxidoreductase [Bryobacteraceae bacterium]